MNLLLTLGIKPKNKYSTEAGNGKAIKEYIEKKEAIELPDGNFIIVTKTKPKLDENGKQCFKSLYDDIQDQKDSVDFQKILNANMTIDQIKLAINSNQQLIKAAVPEKYGDFSNFATVEKLQEIKNNAKLAGQDFRDFQTKSEFVIKKYNDLYKQFQKQQKELNEIKKYQHYQNIVKKEVK